MKLLAILLTYSFFIQAEIDDSSFKNKDKYLFLSEKSIGIRDSFNVKIKFIPPKGKKVNTASFLKIWEKEKQAWRLTETLELGSKSEEFYDNLLLHNVILNSKHSMIAIEIDFIHCTYSGGQCDQERYLGKINRQKKSAESFLFYSLKI